ncbi:MAG: hypothetical protein NT175_04110 [Bacteroidetes bacterium]|nr:hypothetical protein [Bacteroidota bacterium]
MEINVDTTNPSQEEVIFQDYLKHGDDFYKIEIYRHALTWYKKALEVKPDDPLAKEKVTALEQKIKGERKVFIILLAVAALIVAVIMTIKAL